MPGSFGTTNSDDGAVAFTQSSAKSGIFAHNDATNAAPSGTPGGNGVFGLSTVPNASGVFGANNNGGTGVAGHSDRGDGVQASTKSSGQSGIFARNDATLAAPAGTPGGNGVFGLSTVPNASGVFGANNNGGTGVFGTCDRGDGVIGVSNASGKSGVVGINNSNFEDANGVFGSCGVGGNAIHGRGGTLAGFFEGGVKIQGGSLQVANVGGIGGEISADSIFAPNKHFIIDHPCDPENKYLIHATVESSERMNIYSGVVALDQSGEAVVELPDWFEALNSDCRYQLTCIGGFSPVYIAGKVAAGRFKIAGGQPGLEVSWQVAAVRKDRWALEHPLVLVREKAHARRNGASAEYAAPIAVEMK